MTKDQRILYLITSSGWGGAERYVSVLADAATALGEVHVIAGEGDGTLFDRLPHGAYVMRSKHLKRRIAPISDLLAAAEVRRYVRSHGITLIHANSTKAGLIAALASRLMRHGPRVIYTAHGWAFLETDRSPLFRAVAYRSERFASRFRDATIVLSEKERRVALDRGLADEAHLHLIPHGIAKDAVGSMTREDARLALFDGGDAGFVFGTVANAYPAKALPLLVAAFDRIAGDRPDVKLLIIGDGPSMPALRDRRARSRYRDRIVLTGSLAAAPHYIRAFDVFVLSSTKEGMPWAVLEASLAGVPIVATRVGALPEMLRDGETGLLVPPGDSRALADAMAGVHDDGTLRERLKDGAPRVAESRPEELMVKRTLKAYWAEA